MKEIRLLKPDEIDVRVSNSVPEGVTLILYKDARCDMAILDETFGPMNWQKTYSRNNVNCILSIWDEDKKQWIAKEDAGSAGNYERDKSLASDSFKRAAVAWGIGRELYTSPTLFFPAKLLKNFNGERCLDRFVITNVDYDNRCIVSVNIKNITSGAEINVSENRIKVITYPNTATDNSATPAAQPVTENTKVDVENHLPFD